MIIRAAMGLALVWLFLPHHPDLGLPVPASAAYDMAALCAAGPASTMKREAIFKRLREVRAELRGNEKARSNFQSANGGQKTWNRT